MNINDNLFWIKYKISFRISETLRWPESFYDGGKYALNK